MRTLIDPGIVPTPPSTPRLVIFGRGSFIAKHLSEAAAGVTVVGLSHTGNPLDAVREGDLLVNCAIDPDFRTLPYEASRDLDLRLARVAAEKGAHFTMLSTRKVYPAGARWDAVESAQATGDETPYGKNKARAEQAVMEALNGNATILRMSNVIGFEYNPPGKRGSFMGLLLASLRVDQTIRFSMNVATRRDFLPVTASAKAILDASQQRLAGVFNLGCGFPVRCGDIANWIMIGYQGGQLIVDRADVHDEFFLNMGKWRSLFPPPTTPDDLTSYCIELGRGLRNA